MNSTVPFIPRETKNSAKGRLGFGWIAWLDSSDVAPAGWAQQASQSTHSSQTRFESMYSKETLMWGKPLLVPCRWVNTGSRAPASVILTFGPWYTNKTDVPGYAVVSWRWMRASRCLTSLTLGSCLFPAQKLPSSFVNMQWTVYFAAAADLLSSMAVLRRGWVGMHMSITTSPARGTTCNMQDIIPPTNEQEKGGGEPPPRSPSREWRPGWVCPPRNSCDSLCQLLISRDRLLD